MTTKKIKFYQLYENLCKFDYIRDTKVIAKFFDNILALDYGYGVEMWEYFASVYEAAIARDSNLSKFFGDELLAKFYAIDSKKAIKLLMDSNLIGANVYVNGSVCSIAYSYLYELLTAGKIDQADYVLKLVIKNPSLSFGEFFKKLMLTMLDDITKKTGGPPKLSKKMHAFLMSYINKIKTDEKPLLKQRLVELA